MNTPPPLSPIAAKLYELEQERFSLLENNNKERIYGGIAFLGGSLFLYFSWFKPDDSQIEFSTFLLSLLVLGVLVGKIVQHSRDKRIGRLKAKVKSDLVTTILHTIDADLTYTPESNIYEHEFMASGIFNKKFSRYTCEDMIEGTLNGVRFRLTEIHTEVRIRRSLYRTDYRGPFLIIPLPKSLAGEAYIYPANYEHGASTFWRSKHPWAGGRMGSKVKFNNSKFSNTFQVISNNHKAIRSLLTDKLRKDLLKLPPKTYLSIIGDKMYLAIDTGYGLLNINIYKRFLEKGFVEKIHKELHQLIGIVKVLDLKNLN